MNEITKECVKRAVKKSKRLALVNNDQFAYIVEKIHWDLMLAKYGWKLKQRSLELYYQFNPLVYVNMGKDGWVLDDGFPMGFDLDMRLSHKTVAVLERKIARDPELQLEDWGDYPLILAEPQMSLF
jgi:hypothetical protein